MKFDLTFAIPMYNAKLFILKLLKCFKVSNNILYEILIVDDGSTDDSFNICQSFAKTSNINIRIIQQKNSGVSTARNALIKNTNSTWITFIDSDDTIDFDGYLETLNKLLLSKYDYYINIENDYDYNKMKDHFSIDYMIENELINSPWSKFYKVELLKENKILFDRSLILGEDLLFNLSYYKVCKKIGLFNRNIYIYNDNNASSLTHKLMKNKYDILMSCNEKCKNLLLNEEGIDALEFIRVKNTISSIGTYLKMNEDRKKIIYPLIKESKNQYKMKFINSVSKKSKVIYFLWYFLPKFVLVKFINKYFNS